MRRSFVVLALALPWACPIVVWGAETQASLSPAMAPVGAIAAPVAASAPDLASLRSQIELVQQAGTSALGLEALRDVAEGRREASVAERPAAAALYHLLSRPEMLEGERARLSVSLGGAQAESLLKLSRELQDLAKKDRNVRALLAKDAHAASDAVSRLFDGLAAEDTAQAALTGMDASSPETRYHALDSKTLNDLELFAPETGTYDVINRTATPFGAARLAWLLRHPSLDAARIQRRQEAVKALMEDAELRQSIDGAFQRLGAAAGDDLKQDFAQGGMRLSRGMRWVLVMPPLMAAVLYLMLASMPLSPFQLALFMGQMVMMASVMFGGAMGKISSMRREKLEHYRAVVRFAREVSGPLARSSSPALQAVGRALAVDDSAKPAMATLSRSLDRMLKSGANYAPDALWFHSVWSLPMLEDKLERARADVARVLSTLAELDAFKSLALYGESLGDKATAPKLRDGGDAYLKILDGNHPLLASRGASVPNGVGLALDLQLGRGEGLPNFGVLTGENMGGKSTFLKMSGLLTLLAQMGSLVPAAAMELSPLKLITSIDIRDNLADGKSLYRAEAERGLSIVRAADSGPGHFIVMDEILQGTNPEESTRAQWGVVEHLAKTGNLFFLATHNPKITELEGRLPGVANYHVEETVQDGKMTFTHKVLPGRAKTRNGLRTLEFLGYPADVLESARRLDLTSSAR